jgi:broad specificity phosphatase PhoE
MEVFLIRHGQSANNALEDVSQRHMDPQLTEVGRRQTGLLAEFLRAGGHVLPAERQADALPLDRLYCSPMVRALQTAEPLGRVLGLRPEVWVEIHEVGGIYLDHGDERGTVGYPGQTRSQLAERFPDFLLPKGITEKGWWKGGMEAYHEGQGRAIGVATALRTWAGEEGRLGLVTHGGFMSCLLKALGQQLPGDDLHYDHYNTAITRLKFLPKVGLIITYQNRVEHLLEELITY